MMMMVMMMVILVMKKIDKAVKKPQLMPTLIDENGVFVKTLKKGNKAVIAAGEQVNVDSAMKNNLDEQVAKNLRQKTIDFEVKKKRQ